MDEKIALITGASQGIGMAIAKKFADESYTVIINYNNTEPKELIEYLEKKSFKYKAVKADIGNFNEAKALINEAKSINNRIDVLVNNAGIVKDNLLLRMTEDEFDSVINTNLKGAFNTIKHVSKVMLKQKEGSIINISSVVALMGNIGQANYIASKAGLIGLTKATAKELGSRNIRCNAVAPGFIKSKMTENLSDDVKNKMLDNIALNKFGNDIDVAESVYFLANSKYITGQVLGVNGGLLMH